MIAINCQATVLAALSLTVSLPANSTGEKVSQTVSPVSEIRDHYTQALLQAADIFNRSSIWPGFDLLSQPILLIEGIKATLIAHPHPPIGFTIIQDQPINVAVQLITRFSLTEDFNSQFPVGGAKVFAVRIRSDRTVAENMRLIVHERFHVFQETNFSRLDSLGRYSVEDPENQALAGLEQRCLAAALTERNPDKGRLYASEFVAVRKVRNGRYGRKIRDIEDAEEQLEGSADYVTNRFAIAAKEAQRGLVANQPTELLVEKLRELPAWQSMEKTRYYNTGAAQGHILDEAHVPSWKDQLAVGIPFAELMADSFCALPSRREVLVANAKEKHGFASMLKAAVAERERHSLALMEAVKQFELATGIEVRFTFPISGHSMRYGIVGPQYRLDTGEELFTFLDYLTVAEKEFRLSIRKRAVILGQDIRFHVASLGLKVLVDSREILLQPASHRFRTIKIVGDGCELEAKKRGVLRLDIHQWKIDWDQEP